MPAESKIKPFFLLWEVSKGHRFFYILSFVFMLLFVFCGFLLPQAIRFVVDRVIGGESAAAVIPWCPRTSSGFLSLSGPMETLLFAGFLVAGIAFVEGTCGFIYHKSLALGSERLIKCLRDRLYSHIQYLPYEWHVKIQTGDIIQRCTSDVETVRGFISNQLTEIVRAVALVIFAYSILFPMNLSMALISFSFLPVIFLYSFFFLQKASDRFLEADEGEGQLLAIAQENFTGVRVVRAFGRERYEVDRFDNQNRLFSGLWIKL